jgi:ribonucleoside-triphosphate reductase
MLALKAYNNVIPLKIGGESTDNALFVRTSHEELAGWNREKIVEALIRETFIDKETADNISLEIERFIRTSRLKTITASLIRELVNAKLLERGLEDAYNYHTRLGMPLFDVEELIVLPNKENANVPHGPEATNLTLAEGIKKEYALMRVFSPRVADSHIRGNIHLHDLGFVDRPYCSGQSLAYIQKFGLHLPNSLANAKPAKHPEVLLAHLIKFSAALQCHFAGAIGWDAVNLFFAPYITGCSDSEVEQLAQMLIFEYSQQAVARGGQAIFSDINLYWEVPKHFETVQALGPGGEYTGKTYKDYEKDAQRFVWALFDVYKKGDASGRPFFFPKPLVHITEKFFKTPGYEGFLRHICDVASFKGNTYFVFDRGETAKISECCRLSFKLDENDLKEAKEPWKMRYSALQNVTVNLPRIAYKANGDEARFFQILTDSIAVAVQAHKEKKAFIEKLLSQGEKGPLGLLNMNLDGESYLRLKCASYLIGMIGLNEMVLCYAGENLHESEKALKFGLKVIAHMKLISERFGRMENMKFVLEQTPAESTAYRFARLDQRYFVSASKSYLQGNIQKGEIYHTNSTLFPVGAPVNTIQRVKYEDSFSSSY